MIPNRIKMIPPNYSAYFSHKLPSFFPNNTQTKERIKVVIPMVVIATNRLTFKKAKLTPTANASMLVAMAKRRMSLNGME